MTEYDAPAFETTGLGVRFRRNQALRDCTVALPQGRVAALVGPNGAGKTTLMHTLVGLQNPTTGSVGVFGKPMNLEADLLARMAFLAQDKPLYHHFTVADHLRMGRALNVRWDDELARARLAELNIPLKRKAGKLSGGQQAQVALTLALAKRPDLLILDEPLANLDPLARNEVMGSLMQSVADSGMTVLLSSHVVSDLVDTCDWLIVLNAGQVQVSADMDDLVAGHRVLSGPAEQADGLANGLDVVSDSRVGRQATLTVRTGRRRPVIGPQWTGRQANLEEIVLAYLRSPGSSSLPRPSLAIPA